MKNEDEITQLKERIKLLEEANTNANKVLGDTIEEMQGIIKKQAAVMEELYELPGAPARNPGPPLTLEEIYNLEDKYTVTAGSSLWRTFPTPEEIGDHPPAA